MTEGYAYQELESRERFLRLFVEEYTDGSYYYATLRHEEGMNCYCEKPAVYGFVDVEDESAGGAPMCEPCLKELLEVLRDDAKEFSPENLFYKPTGKTAEQAWEGGPEKWNTGWKGLWWLFLPFGTEPREEWIKDSFVNLPA